MTDFKRLITEMRRPRLLIRAARHGLADYRRERDLKHILAGKDRQSPEAMLPHLISEEAHMETIRRSGDASYSIMRHIELLIAVIGEARLLAPRP